MLAQAFLFFFLIFFLIFLIKIWSSKMSLSLCSDYPFECGVSSNLSSRKPFSLPFFLISIIFLLFDMEILLIFPFIFFEKVEIFYFIPIVILILTSLVMEWIYGSLNWTGL